MESDSMGEGSPASGSPRSGSSQSPLSDQPSSFNSNGSNSNTPTTSNPRRRASFPTAFSPRSSHSGQDADRLESTLTYQDILDEIALFQEMLENRQPIDYTVYEELITLRDSHPDHDTSAANQGSSASDDDGRTYQDILVEIALFQEMLENRQPIDYAVYEELKTLRDNHPDHVRVDIYNDAQEIIEDYDEVDADFQNANSSNYDSLSNNVRNNDVVSEISSYSNIPENNSDNSDRKGIDFDETTRLDVDSSSVNIEDCYSMDPGRMSPSMEGDYETDVSRVSYIELLEEIELEVALIGTGQQISHSKLDRLLHQKESHPEYKKEMARERAEWRVRVKGFCEHSLNVMRSFIPVDVFSSNIDTMVASGIPIDIARRIIRKQCLWLTRMSKDEISRMHEVDLNSRYNISGHSFDVVEVSAIYSNLPEYFANDDNGKKLQWYIDLESILKNMLNDLDNERLPLNKIRHGSYTDYERESGQIYGPIADRTGTRPYHFVKKQDSVRRKSFMETCEQHSIIGSLRQSQRIEQGVGFGSRPTSSSMDRITSVSISRSSINLDNADQSNADNSSGYSMKATSAAPAPLIGNIRKQGHINIFSWELRKFVLSEGSLMYFDPITGTPKGEPTNSLAGYEVELKNSLNSGSSGLELVVSHAVKRGITMRFDFEDDLVMWKKAIQEHIDYCNALCGSSSNSGNNRSDDKNAVIDSN